MNRRRWRATTAFVVMHCSLVTFAQPAWAPAGIPFLTMEMRNIYTDTLSDAIYFCGQVSYDGDFNFTEQAIPYYSNGQWDTIGPIIGHAECVVRWGDTLVVGGDLYNLGGIPYSGCLGWVNGQWHPFGDFPETPPYKFRIIDGELYAIGAFVHVDGQLCNGLAKRVGGQWTSVGSMVGVNQNYLSDIVRYNGHLVIAGAIGFDWTSEHGLGILNDTTWEPLGPGIIGNWGQGRALAVYQGDLYVGGAIDINDGNAGHGIMRWEGEQFHPVGDGLQGMYNDFSMPTGASVMQVRDGLLYCSGQFRFAGHVPAVGVATWDGTNWCGLGGDLRLNVESFDFYHDTLFVGPFHEAEGVDVNCAAKYIGSYPDTCTQFNTGISQPIPPSACSVSWSVDGGVLIIGTLPASLPYRICDMAGRLVTSGLLRNGGGQANARIATDGLASGCYAIQLADGSHLFAKP